MQTILPHVLNDKAIQNLVAAHKTSIHVAFIMKRGHILAKATNKIGSRSRGAGYSDCTIHAEKAVVKELGDRNMMRGAIMYVIRISRSKTLVGNERVQNSEPCHDCHLFLTKCHEKYGLRKVFYSTHEFVELDFEDRPDKRPPMDLGRPPTWVRK
jgi:hypothetical protein